MRDGHVDAARQSVVRRWFRTARIRIGTWILKDAERPSGAATIVAASFFASAVIPLALEPFLIILTTNLPHLWRRFALSFAAGSILGGVVNYAVGLFLFDWLGDPVIRFWGEQQTWNEILTLAQGRWGLVPVAIVSFGPGPMKLTAMAAGAAGVPFWAFLAILVTGRVVRFSAIALFAKYFGVKIHTLYKEGHKRKVAAAIALVCLALALAYASVRIFVF